MRFRKRANVRAAGLSVVGALLAVLVIVSVASAAHSNKRTGRAASSASLTMAIESAPQSLDPSKDDNGDGLFAAELLYSPLINETYAGAYTPGLATSWHYVGKGNKKFELTVRKGAKFSNGQPVTAAAVAAGLIYNSKGTGPAGSNFTGLKARATGDNVILTVTKPVASFPELLSARDLTADIPCPASLKNSASLASQPCGAGEYVLNKSATVSGSKYVFSPNPKYYDPAAIHYKSITLDVIPSTTSALEALRTGQVQVDQDTDLGMYAAAKSAGLVVTTLGVNGFVPLWIMDRNGKLVKPLGNVMVRQALNYAIDRPAIAKAAYGPLGEAFDEPVPPGYNGYDPAVASYYRYDPALAKKLLAKAGYPHGFGLSVLYITSQSQAGIVLQAMKQEFAKIGVTLTLVPESGFPPFSAAQATLKYASFMLTWGGQDLTPTANLLWASNGSANAFHATPPAFTRLFDAAQAAPPATEPRAMQAVTAYVVKNAWQVVTCASKGFIISTKGVSGLPPAGNAEPGGFNVAALHP